ncbi:MAG: phosphoribosylglycinamide formyltransferase [Euryarchaeota archaeon RBG_16_68_12]|nr:MAG: phosphoribosylglycinamide formyltransferase [Euryarchaeota archaeon RBG_16_68_12]
MVRINVGVLASGRGTDFQSLIDAKERGTLDVHFAVLICNVPGAPVIERAQGHGIPAVVVDHKGFGKDREAFEREVVRVLREHGVDLVVFAGFMRLVTGYFVREFPSRIINIHPALLPAFPGTHGQEDAIRHGVKVSGCTIHFVDESTDGGPIIFQKAVPVLDDDTPDTLAARILEQEHVFLPLAVQLFAEGRLKVEGRRVRIDTRGITLPPMA